MSNPRRGSGALSGCAGTWTDVVGHVCRGHRLGDRPLETAHVCPCGASTTGHVRDGIRPAPTPRSRAAGLTDRDQDAGYRQTMRDAGRGHLIP